MSVENTRNTSEQQRQMEDDGEAPNPFEHQLDLPWYRIPQVRILFLINRDHGNTYNKLVEHLLRIMR